MANTFESQSCKPKVTTDKMDTLIQRITNLTDLVRNNVPRAPIYYPLRTSTTSLTPSLQSPIFEVGEGRMLNGGVNETPFRLYNNYIFNLAILANPSINLVTSGLLIAYGTNRADAPRKLSDMQEIDRIDFEDDWPVAGSVAGGGYFLSDYEITTRYFAFSIDITIATAALIECELVFRAA